GSWQGDGPFAHGLFPASVDSLSVSGSARLARTCRSGSRFARIYQRWFGWRIHPTIGRGRIPGAASRAARRYGRGHGPGRGGRPLARRGLDFAVHFSEPLARAAGFVARNGGAVFGESSWA